MTNSASVFDNAARYEDFLRPVWEFLAISEDPISAEAIFVFGGVDLLVPSHAASLYLDGWAPVVAITGSSGPLSKDLFSLPEARLFAFLAQRLGVPEEAVLVEEEATNTKENVSLGLRLVAQHNIVPTTLLLVAKPFLMRRCVATLRAQRPDIRAVPSPPSGALPSFVDRPRREFALRLVQELERLERYSTTGDIAAQDIPTHVEERARDIGALLAASPRPAR